MSTKDSHSSLRNLCYNKRSILLLAALGSAVLGFEPPLDFGIDDVAHGPRKSR
jgi:hypothetical protein